MHYKTDGARRVAVTKNFGKLTVSHYSSARDRTNQAIDALAIVVIRICFTSFLHDSFTARARQRVRERRLPCPRQCEVVNKSIRNVPQIPDANQGPQG